MMKITQTVESFSFEVFRGLPINVRVRTSYYPQQIKLPALCASKVGYTLSTACNQQELDIYSQIGEMLRNQ